MKRQSWFCVLNRAGVDAHTDAGAHETEIASRSFEVSDMKRTIAHLLLGVCVAGLVRADPTTQSMQQALKDQGFYYGKVTGDKSAETIAAIRRYQIRNGLHVTGDMDLQTLRSLNLSSNSVASAQPTGKSAVTQSNSPRGDDRSRLGQNPPAPSLTEPDRRLETNPDFASALYKSAPRRINQRIAVAEVQRQLMSRGYYRGRIDGRSGRRTTFALRAFQLSSGLPPTGQLDTSTLDALGVSDANLTYSEPASHLYETWVPVTKFKHGKWKVKWKKYRRGDGEDYAAEDPGENGDASWQGENHDD
jgi:peptidoglycan hydrolase-like protein with peptidoglycan-binding domain